MDPPMGMAGSCPSQPDPAPARLGTDLHAIEHPPRRGAGHCGQPPSRLPAGWNLRPPGCRLTRAGRSGPSAVVGEAPGSVLQRAALAPCMADLLSAALYLNHR